MVSCDCWLHCFLFVPKIRFACETTFSPIEQIGNLWCNIVESPMVISPSPLNLSVYVQRSNYGPCLMSEQRE